MLDLQPPTKRRTRTVKLTIACPVCDGLGEVSIPSFDGAIERGFRNPISETRVFADCGCDDGKVELLVDLTVLEDAIEDALVPVIDHATRGFDANDRDFLIDDISTLKVARATFDNLTITVVNQNAK